MGELHELWSWHPPVGVWIGVLGLLGVLVPLIRENIGRREKAVWTAVMFLLLPLEVKSVYQDRNEHDRDQAETRGKEAASFERIGKGIKGVIQQANQDFAATIAKSDRIFSGVNEASANQLAVFATWIFRHSHRRVRCS